MILHQFNLKISLYAFYFYYIKLLSLMILFKSMFKDGLLIQNLCV